MIVPCATVETGHVAVVKLPLEERIDEMIQAQEGSGGQRGERRRGGLERAFEPAVARPVRVRRDAVGE